MSYTGPGYKEETVKCERTNETNLIMKLSRNHNIFKYHSALNGIIVNIDNKPVPFIFKGIDDDDREYMTYIAIDVFGMYGPLQHIDTSENTMYGKIYYEVL